MSYRRATWLLLAGFVFAIAGSGVAAGEGPEVFGLKTSGDVVLGGRVFIERPPPDDRAKFEEYRDLPESAFLEYLRLRGDSKDDLYTVEIFGKNGGQTDQEFKLRAYEVGSFDFLFEWNQIPHLLCTTCRTIYIESEPKNFTLPSSYTGNRNDFNSAPVIDEIGFRTNAATVHATYSPTPDWDIGVDLGLLYKNGNRPVGFPFGFNNAVEVPVPINSYTYGAHVNAGYAGDGYQLQFGYDLSVYDNNVNYFRVENPALANPTFGQGSRFPSNWATSLSLAGGVNLPMNTRVTGSVSYGWRFQDQEFLPLADPSSTAASNPAVVSQQAALPDGLGGQVNILRFNLNATSRPLDKLTTTANVRVYSYDDNSRTIPFETNVEYDATVRTDDAIPLRGQEAKRYPYTKYNAGADARYELFDSLAIKAGFYYERWARSAYVTVPPEVEDGGSPFLNTPREVAKTNEYTPKVMVDYTPFDWLQFRTSYAYSWRSGTDYLQASEDQFALLRKYTMADRNRNRVDFLADVWAMDNLTFTANFSWQDDAYSSSSYGVQDVTTWSAGGDVSWQPLEWLRVFAGYLHESVSTDSRLKFRTPQLGGQLDNPTYDWLSEVNDTYDTVRVGLDATIIPKKLDAGATWNYSIGQTDMNSSNPTPPVPFDEGAEAGNFPGIENRLSLLNVFVRYWLTENWAATVRYSFENLFERDYRSDGLGPFNPANTQNLIFLGADTPGYTAHYITLSIGYSF